MSLYVWPIVFALFVWWFSTGLVLYVVGRPRASHVNAVAVTTLLLAGGLWGLYETSDDTTIAGAYLSFASALLVWGWHEMTFLLGFITGPRKDACPPKIHGRAPLGAAIEAVIYHEFAILLTAALICLLTAGGANQVGLWTFVILWLARLSTKFNIYLGVPNHTEQFLPPHLTYLASYFCRRPMNLLFPISVTASTIITWLLVSAAMAPGASAHEVAGFVFLATLMALALLEHWFLVLPLPSAELWTWGLASREGQAAPVSSGNGGEAGKSQPLASQCASISCPVAAAGANA
ncbi:MAG: putative photosynthetic complex assembly protein PuhE [Hyphomicrobium sp.]